MIRNQETGMKGRRNRPEISFERLKTGAATLDLVFVSETRRKAELLFKNRLFINLKATIIKRWYCSHIATSLQDNLY